MQDPGGSMGHAANAAACHQPGDRMVQCLDLSRPESISATGYCADVLIQAVRYPQPMLYSPSKGTLVTYQPPGKTGVQERHWLDSLSTPKHITPKCHKALQSSHQQEPPPPQQQGPAEQQHHPKHPQQQQQPQSHRSGLSVEAAAIAERSTSTAQQQAAAAGTTAACLLERQLVSYPQVFSWGGRVKGKHSSLCRMHVGAPGGAAGASSLPANTRNSTPAVSTGPAATPAEGAHPLAAAPAAAAGPGSSTTSGSLVAAMSSSSSNSGAGQGATTAGPASSSPLLAKSCWKAAADAQVAAAAAQLGANANRLLNLLERRKQQQQQQDTQQQSMQHEQQSRQRTGRAPPRQQQQSRAAPLGQDAGTHTHENQNDDLGCGTGLDYLRL